MKRVSKNTGYFKSFDGTRLYYEVRGTGKPLVLCYGIGCLINHWQQQLKYFSSRYKVITFDYRAHHLSEVPQDRAHLNVDSIARDVRCLLDHLEIEKASLWGHSFGAQVITRTYDMYPESVANLVFINGFVSDPIKGMFGNEMASSFFNVFKSGYKTLPETLSYLWKKAVTNPLAIQFTALTGGFNLSLTSLKDVEIYARGVASMDLDSFITLFESMMKFDGRPVLERIEVPVLIIAGSKDSVTPLRFQEEMNKRIRNSHLLVVPYGSHCTLLDMPEFVNLRIEKFLKENTY
ncbi:MAG: alpha/beta hydrolase [Bdellovibrionaceae bacterium]|nr:alpha/beta hydrolase [Bdellovibrionales bacterium]MCB9085429.1 alpha/beta hydrolase [Pseudobdellovibrionaceae bacterium]